MDITEGDRQESRLDLPLIIRSTLYLCLLLLLSACGDATAPTMTAMPTAIPLLPTPAVTRTPAPARTAQEPASPLSPLGAQIPVTATETLTTGTEGQGLVGVTVAGVTSMTITEIPIPTVTIDISAGATLTVSEGQAANEELPCRVETDIALLSYPEIEGHLGCALTAAGFDAVALNEFGPGPDYNRFMLWFSSENQIYVLQPDKTWQVYADTWTEEQETFTCNPLGGEATSPPLPRRGFGKIWCTVEGLQELMGTVEREERLCQHTVTQRFTHGRLVACYEDATIRFFRVMDDHTWDQMLIQ